MMMIMMMRIEGQEDAGREEEMKGICNDRMRQGKDRTPRDGGLERPSAALPD